MKKDHKSQLKSKAIGELQADLKSLRIRLRDLKFDLAAGKVKNVSEINKIKKEIAVVLTLINK